MRTPSRSTNSPALGTRPSPDLEIELVEVSTGEQVVRRCDQGGIDLAILDGEAQPTGGMGLSRQLKNEIDDCPPIIVTVRRRDDRWLATWSQADAVLVHPLDPLTAAETVADVLRCTQADPGLLEDGTADPRADRPAATFERG